MEKDEALKLAHGKFDHEHSRWNTWGIFFFGSIVTVFTLWSQLKDIIPSYVPCLLGAAISLSWIFVALGIRRSNLSWVEVINEIETSNSKDFNVNELFQKFEKGHNYRQDFLDFSLYRVTKVLVYAGVVSFILFISLSLVLFNKPPQKTNATIVIPDLTKTIDSIETLVQKVERIDQRAILLESKLDDIDDAINEYNKANSADAKNRAAD